MLIDSVKSPFAAVNAGAAEVFGWFIDLASVAALINYFWMCVAWIRFDAGMKAQNVSRDILPFRGVLMPWTPWMGLAWCVLLAGALVARVGFYIHFSDHHP